MKTFQYSVEINIILQYLPSLLFLLTFAIPTPSLQLENRFMSISFTMSFFGDSAFFPKSTSFSGFEPPKQRENQEDDPPPVSESAVIMDTIEFDRSLLRPPQQQQHPKSLDFSVTVFWLLDRRGNRYEGLGSLAEMT